MTTNKTPKQKVVFPCCNFMAIGFRGAMRVDGFVRKYAKCPKCGRIHLLSSNYGIDVIAQ